MDVRLVLSDLAVGVVVGLTGMGGGALMTSMLGFFFGVNPALGSFERPRASAIMKSFGGAVHPHRGGSVPPHEQLVVTLLDADLYSSTKLVLDHLTSHIRPGVVLRFDDMSRPEHEPAAFSDYLKESRQVFEVVAVDETLNCAAFRCVG